jgi:hypothetical protein
MPPVLQLLHCMEPERPLLYLQELFADDICMQKFSRNSDGKRPGCRCEDDIEINFKNIEFADAN